MDGHFEQAAAILSQAAGLVPVEPLMEVVERLTEVLTLAHQAGSGFGERVAADALAIQERLQDEVGLLNQLREDLDGAANQALAVGGPF